MCTSESSSVAHWAEFSSDECKSAREEALESSNKRRGTNEKGIDHRRSIVANRHVTVRKVWL